MLETNEDMKNGRVKLAIISHPKLKIKDLVRKREGKHGPSTWFCGTKHIEGTFTTPGMD